MIKINIYILLILILAGCATKNFFSGDENKSIDRKGAVIDNKSNTKTAEELYNNAKFLLKKEQYTDAIDLYRQIEANYPFSKYAEASHIELGFANYKLARWDASIAIIDRFIAMNSTSKILPYAHYLRGLVNFNRGKSFFNNILPHTHTDKDSLTIKKAFDDFSYVYKNYNNSEYAIDSYKRMVYLRNALAAHELNVGIFYYKRKAYIATINRCIYIIENYPNALANKDALLFLKHSYEKLLMLDNARDIDKVIQTNFPDYKSEYFQDILNNNQKQSYFVIGSTADKLAIALGFDIKEQKIDNFSNVYSVEYFVNNNIIERESEQKLEKYSITFKSNQDTKNYNNKKKFKKNLLDFFYEDDISDLNLKDIIVEEKIKIKNNENFENNDEKNTSINSKEQPNKLIEN